MQISINTSLFFGFEHKLAADVFFDRDERAVDVIPEIEFLAVGHPFEPDPVRVGVDELDLGAEGQDLAFLDVETAHVPVGIVPQVESGVDRRELGHLQHFFRDDGPGAGGQHQQHCRGRCDKQRGGFLHIKTFSS